MTTTKKLFLKRKAKTKLGPLVVSAAQTPALHYSNTKLAERRANLLRSKKGKRWQVGERKLSYKDAKRELLMEFAELDEETRKPYEDQVARARTYRKLKRFQIDEPIGGSGGNDDGDMAELAAPLEASLWGLGNEHGIVAPLVIKRELSSLPEATHSSIAALDAHLASQTGLGTSMGVVVEDDRRTFNSKATSKWIRQCRPCSVRHDGLCIQDDALVLPWALAALKLVRKFLKNVTKERVGRVLVRFKCESASSTATAPLERYYWISQKIGWPSTIYLLPARFEAEMIRLNRPVAQISVSTVLVTCKRDWKGSLSVGMVRAHSERPWAARLIDDASAMIPTICLPAVFTGEKPRVAGDDSDDELRAAFNALGTRVPKVYRMPRTTAISVSSGSTSSESTSDSDDTSSSSSSSSSEDAPRRGKDKDRIRKRPTLSSCGFQIMKDGYKMTFRKKALGSIKSFGPCLTHINVYCNQHKNCKGLFQSKWAPSDLEFKKWLVRGHKLSAEAHMTDLDKLREDALTQYESERKAREDAAIAVAEGEAMEAAAAVAVAVL